MSSCIGFYLCSFWESGLSVSTARFCRFEACFRVMSPLWTHLSCQRLQTRESQQVVRRADDVGMQLHPLKAAYQSAAQSTISFYPAEDFLDTLALALAHGITGMPRGAPIQS